MNAFIGRLMCCCCLVVVIAAPVASVYGVLDHPARRRDDGRPSVPSDDASESHDGFESPDSDELDHDDGNIAVADL